MRAKMKSWALKWKKGSEFMGSGPFRRQFPGDMPALFPTRREARDRAKHEGLMQHVTPVRVVIQEVVKEKGDGN